MYRRHPVNHDNSVIFVSRKVIRIVMLKLNEYFGGTVKSIALENEEGNATVGVMEAGEYTFGTSTIELMTVTSGVLEVLLPGESSWKTYKKGETFRVEKDVQFKVNAKGQVAYYCLYI
jgi:hypothetical protein